MGNTSFDSEWSKRIVLQHPPPYPQYEIYELFPNVEKIHKVPSEVIINILPSPSSHCCLGREDELNVVDIYIGKILQSGAL